MLAGKSAIRNAKIECKIRNFKARVILVNGGPTSFEISDISFHCSVYNIFIKTARFEIKKINK